MLTAPKVLDQYYLETRCMLLEIAAVLDRFDRAVSNEGNGNGNANANANAKASRDQRLELIYQSLKLLGERPAEPNRAERLLNLFSDPT